MLLLSLGFFAMAQPEGNPKKLALIIGNKDYQYATVLKNTLNDAQDIATTLKNVGFETVLYTNLDYTGFLKAVNDFAQKAPDYDVLLFYFSGHGMMYQGENYLVPVDASLRNNEQQIEIECINIKRITTNFNSGEGKANIAIIDACRNKPFNRSWASATRDIGEGSRFRLKGVSGSIVAQSADEGETSSDNPKGRNGLYTSCLIKYIQEPGLSINEVFQLARKEVKEKSKNAQNPIEFNQLVGNFYFVTANATVTKTRLPESSKNREKEKAKNKLVTPPPITLKNNTSQPLKQSVKLQEGTSIRLTLKEELNSKKASVGDPVEMEVSEDVEIDGYVVIKAGTHVKGEVTQNSKAKMLGKQGTLDFIVTFTSSVDNQNIRLRSTRKFEGKNKSAGMAVAAAFALPALFIKGKEAVIPKGTQLSAFVDNSYTIQIGSDQ
jgi:hypothetical protein